jgi:3,4-dihydroxy 2-butanone 4-phosphate synthase/GTP cyclohydrolase II
MEKAGLRVVERVALEVEPSDAAVHYLRTKKTKLGHLLDRVG